MRYRLLGPLEVLDGDRVVSVGSGRRLSLLALLLIDANEVVPADRLIDELWGESPPPTATKSLQVRVSQLRRALGQGGADPSGGPLLTYGNGYLLRVGEDELDSRRFELALDSGSRALAAGEARRAAALLDDALALWRGSPLTGVEYEPFAQREIARLEELRLMAFEVRMDAALELGEHARAVGELESLVQRHPLRERFRAQLMLALYRSGRQAEALASYRDARQVFAEELGLDPGEELKRLEAAILRQDPALERAARAPEAPPALASAPAPAAPTPVPKGALLLVPHTLSGLPALLGLAEPLASGPVPRELVVAAVVEPAELGAATATLAERRGELLGRGVSVRTAAFSSPSPGEDLVRLASEPAIELALLGAGTKPLEGATGVVLEQAECHVALMADAGGARGDGPVIVPFGGAWHDWTALELGAWVARATSAPLRLIGAASEGREDGRDASRLLADASLIVQRQTGVVAEPLLGRPGRSGIMALSEGAGLLVVGLSERWREEGLGRARTALLATPPAPLVLVRRGERAVGAAPPADRTRFGWSLTAEAS